MSYLGDAEYSDPWAYKRAIFRPPPKNFYVGMLAPVKQGNQYSYGLRIYPVIASAKSSRSSRSSRSSTSSSDSSSSGSENDREYDIWRRWDDCLFFQETLEKEYSRLAREKRARLLAGKGVKGKHLYSHARAASFESLPPGPEPNSIAQDIHQVLPKLNKKNNLFQTPNQAAIQLRARQLSNLMEALFQEDVPTLVAELRGDRLVTDFFGFWRRDFDLCMKEDKASGLSPETRGALATSLTTTIHFSKQSPAEDAAGPANKSTSSLSLFSRLRSGNSSFSDRRSTVSESSRSSSDSSSDSSTIRPRASTDSSIYPLILENASSRIADRPVSALRTLSEDGHDSELLSSRHGPLPRRSHRESSIYMGRNENRDSWQTMSSLSDVLQGINVELDEEHQEPLRNRDSVASFATFQTTDSADAIIPWSTSQMAESLVYRPTRESVASFATFMTDCSANGVLPRAEHADRPASVASVRTLRRSARISVADSQWSDSDSMVDLDSFPMPFSYVPNDSEEDDSPEDDSPPATPIARTAPRLPSIMISPSFDADDDFAGAIYSARPSSRASTIASDFSDYSHTTVNSSASSNTTVDDEICEDSFIVPIMLTVKAVLNDTIVVLRMAESTTYADMRQKLRARFTQQERVALSTVFTVSLITSNGRPRSSSVSSDNSTSHSTAQLKPIDSQEQWAQASSTSKGKLTLLVVDSKQ